MPPIRASEPNGFVDTLPDPAWVECPRCSKPARILRKPHRYRANADAFVSCSHCAFRHEDAKVYRAVHSKYVYLGRPRVACSKCGGNKFDFSDAKVLRHKTEVSLQTRCQGCGHLNLLPARGAWAPVRDGHDHWFGLPLVLRANYASRLIWAYNVEHIDRLEGWIEADLRERSLNAHYMTMAARLPRWMKTAHARRPVLKALAKMRAIAEREGLA